jgi:hypothetical protein
MLGEGVDKGAGWGIWLKTKIFLSINSGSQIGFEIEKIDIFT